jgi:hypothetical protein
MNMKKIALLVGCAALIGAFSITAPGPSWAKKCNAACQVEKVEIKVAAAKAAPEEKATLLAQAKFDKKADKKRKKAQAKKRKKAERKAAAKAAREKTAVIADEAVKDEAAKSGRKKKSSRSGKRKRKK